MKRLFSVFSIILALMTIMLALGTVLPIAEAAADLSVSVTASPSELSGAGSTNVTVTINANVNVEDVKLAGPGLSSPVSLGNLSEGQGTSHTVTLSLGSDQLGAQQTYVITYVVEGEARSASSSVTIKKKGGNPKLNLTVTADKKAVEPGSEVVFTYTVQNAGDVDITDITIKDPGVVSGNIAAGLALSPGKNQQYTKAVTVNADITSSPTATYTAQGQSGTASATPIKIVASTASLAISAKADKETVDQGEEVTFTITVKNTSSVAIDNIQIKDDAGNEIRANLSLNPNASANITHTVTVGESHSYFFTADYPSGGSTKRETSEEIPITMAGSFLFTISVEPTTQEPVIPGDVEFKITLLTDGKLTLKDVVVTEAKLGEIVRLDELAPGTREIIKTIRINEAGTYLFSASGKDNAGTAYTATTQPVALGVSPSASPDTDAPTGSSDPLGTFFKILIVIVILIAVAAAALVILMILDKKKRAQRAAQRGGRAGGLRSDGEPAARAALGTREMNDRARARREAGRRSDFDADLHEERPSRRMPPESAAAPAVGATRRMERVVTPEEASQQYRNRQPRPVPRSAAPAEEDGIRVYHPSRRPYEGAGSHMDHPEIAARLEAARKRRFEVSEEDAKTLEAGAAFGAAAAAGISSIERKSEADLPAKDPMEHDRPRRGFGELIEDAREGTEQSFAPNPTPTIDEASALGRAEEDEPMTEAPRRRGGRRAQEEDDLPERAPALEDVLIEEDGEEAPRKKRSLFGKAKNRRREREEDLFDEDFDEQEDLFGEEEEEDRPRPKRERRPRRRPESREDALFDEEDSRPRRGYADEEEQQLSRPRERQTPSGMEEFSYTPRRRSRR